MLKEDSKVDKGESSIDAVTRHLNTKVKKDAVELLPQSGSTGGRNCFHGVVVGKVIKYAIHPCHANQRNFPVGAEIVYNHYPTVKAGFTKANDDYFDWIAGKNSPWSSAFKLGMSFSDNSHFTPEFWKETGFIFDRPDKIPSNLLHNFLVASRMPREWPNSIKRWSNLTKAGVSPEMALVATSLYPESYSAMHKADWYDWPLDVYSGSDDYVRNFLRHDIQKSVLNPPYSKQVAYTPVNAIWGKGGSKESWYGPDFDKRYFNGKSVTEKELAAAALKEQERLLG